MYRVQITHADEQTKLVDVKVSEDILRMLLDDLLLPVPKVVENQ